MTRFLKILFLTIIGFSTVQSLYAQLSTSVTTIDFGTIQTGDSGVQVIAIQNQFSESVVVQLNLPNAEFKTTGNLLTITANNTKNIEVKFLPRHNIIYNSELILISNSKFGSLSIDLKGIGEYTDSYYSSTKNLWDEDLKKELKSIISANYKNLGYNGARDRMYGEIDNNNGKVTCVYTGREATFNTRSGANSSSFNCEHTWPQSLFSSREPEKADIHHLFPTDVNANSRRGNFKFNIVSSPTWNEGGSAAGNGYFEPRDLHKGDCARAMFYFCTRYTNYDNFLTSQEDLLRTWSEQHPPTNISIARNEAIFKYQNNRNPFVDHPEFLERIYRISTTSTRPENIQVTPSNTSIDVGSWPDPNSTGFHLILYNSGNKAVNYTNISVSKEEYSVTPGSVKIEPGESAVVRIQFRSKTDLGEIKDMLILDAAEDDADLSIPLSGNVTNLSNKDILVKHEHQIYWNPKDEVLHIPPFVFSQVQIFDSKGSTLHLNDIKSALTDINTHTWADGVYFAVLKDENGNVIRKKFGIYH